MRQRSFKVGRRAAACAASLAAILASCSSAADDPLETDGKTIAIVLPDRIPGYPAQIGCGVIEEGERLGYDVAEPQGPSSPGDTAQQAQITQSVLQTNPAGLIFDATDPAAGGNMIRPSVERGLPVVTVDTELEDGALSQSFISSSHEAGGKLGADLLVKQIGGSGSVAAIGMLPTHPITRGRTDGFKEGLTAHPEVQLVDELYPDPDVNEIAAATSALLEAYPDLSGIYTTNDTVASGVASALRSAQRTGSVKVVTWDLQPAGVKLLRDGDITGAVVQNPRELGRLAMQQLHAAITDKEVEPRVTGPLTTATSDNINDPEIQKLYYTADC